eukprot:4849130-Prymnesium_polylepis.1
MACTMACTAANPFARATAIGAWMPGISYSLPRPLTSLPALPRKPGRCCDAGSKTYGSHRMTKRLHSTFYSWSALELRCERSSSAVWAQRLRHWSELRSCLLQSAPHRTSVLPR